MTQENNEELKPNDVVEEQPQEENPAAPSGEQSETEPVDKQSEVFETGAENQPETISVSREEYDKIKTERENYKQGLLSKEKEIKEIRGKDRLKDLSFDENQVTDELDLEITADTEQIKTDYSSKRADVIADFEDKVREMNDEEYKVFKQHLVTSETILLNNSLKKGSFTARKHIADMVNESLDYVNFKFKKIIPLEKETESNVLADIGSVKTIHRTIAAEQISDDDRQVAAKAELSPERIQELKKKGYNI